MTTGIYCPFTYLIGWTWLDRWYYGVRYARGCHPDDLWTKYFTSSGVVKEYREEHGEPDVIEVRQTFNDSLQAREWEEKVLRRLNAVKDERWLNRGNSGKSFFCKGHSEESKKRMKGRPRSEETRIKISQSMKNKEIKRTNSEETRIKISQSNKGKKRPTRSDEHRRKIAELRKRKISFRRNSKKNFRIAEEIIAILNDHNQIKGALQWLER